MKNNCVIVNATALRESGALTILKQFINSVPKEGTYYIFVHESLILNNNKKNINIVRLNKISFLKRFIWDAFGIKKWIKKNKINPTIAISLQNTNFRVGDNIANYIYYHQSIPLYSYKWSIIKKEERSLCFYKHIYPFFVNLLINNRTEVFVQQEFIKERFAEKYKFDKNKIHVVFPDIETPTPEKLENIIINKNYLNLFYPATPFKYKNHKVLLDALSIIDSSLKNKIALYLTCSSEEVNNIYDYKNIEIVFLGKITHANVIWIFENIDTLVFPSYLETLGLPLIEAASLGLPIIASDLPYSREVLTGYEGVAYVNYLKAKEWADELLKLSLSDKKIYNKFSLEGKNTWKYFFDIILRNTK